MKTMPAKRKDVGILLAVVLIIAAACVTVKLTNKQNDAGGALSQETSSGSEEGGNLLGKKQEKAEPVAQPYLRQDLLTLEQENRISLPGSMKKISVLPDEELQGVHFKGQTSHFKGGRISLLGDFDFSGNPVGRVSLSGITDSPHDVNVRIYLDDEKNPPPCSCSTVSKALDTLARLDATVRPANYTRESYAAYAAALGSAADRLKNEAMIPVLIEDLQQQVFKAYSLLELRAPEIAE